MGAGRHEHFERPEAHEAADRRGIAYEELEAAVEANAARLFGW